MKKVTTCKMIRLRKNTFDRVSQCAEKENRSFNNMVETILMREIESTK